MKNGIFEIVEYIGDIVYNKKHNRVICRCNNCGKERNITEYAFVNQKKECTCLTQEYIKSEYGKIEDMEFIEIVKKSTSISKTLVKIRCAKCGICKVVDLQGYISKRSTRHSYYCNEILLMELRTHYGRDIVDKFYRMYYNAKTRTTNETYIKDKPTYECLTFGYDDFYEFYDDYFDEYIESLNHVPLEDISIDRIDNHNGYVKGNIQFISNFENAGKKTIHQSRSYDVVYKGILYENIRNTRKFAREVGLEKHTVWKLFNEKCNLEKYDFKIIKKHCDDV